MSKYSGILYSIRKMMADRVYDYDDEFNAGYNTAINDVERIIFSNEDREKKAKAKQTFWYPGTMTPNDLKPNNTAEYLQIVRAKEDDGEFVKGQIYILVDYWTGGIWLNDDGAYDILYWTKLKWIRYPMPNDELFNGLKRDQIEEMYLK